MSQPEEQAAAMSQISQAIAHDILSMPELRGTDWVSYAMAAEVSDDRIALTAYRYPESGPAVPTADPDNFDRFSELRDATRGPNGETWDVAVVKIQRATGRLVLDFVAGAAADDWRITPQNIDRLPEALRPRPEDFAE